MDIKLLEKVREATGSCSYGYIQEIIQSIEFSHGELTKHEVEEVERAVEKAIDCITASKDLGVPAT